MARRAGGPALAVTYLSLLVLLPVAALVSNAFSDGWSSFWAAITTPEAVAALKLTLVAALLVAIVNSIAGLAIAFVLVRDDFRGKALVSAVIDLPFALPTVVAGLTLLALYGPSSPFHVNLAGTRLGIGAALAFVTLPFCVRSVQPVLAELDAEIEEAAESLGATRRQVLRRILLPAILPAVLAGAGLAFARAVGEFGSVVLISGNLPFKTEVASSCIYSLSQSGDLPAASAVSVVLVLISLARAARHRLGPPPLRRPGQGMSAPTGARRWRLPLRFAVLAYLALLVLLPVGHRVLPSLSARTRRGVGCHHDAGRPARARGSRCSSRSSPYRSTPSSAWASPSSWPATASRAPGCSTRWSTSRSPSPPSSSAWPSSSSTGTPAGSATGWPPGASPSSSRCPASSWPRPPCRCPTSCARCCPCSRRWAPSRSRRPARSAPGPSTVFRRITLPGIRRGLAYGVTLTTARVLGEFGAVAIVSGAIAGKTQTLTLFISDSIDNLDPQSAYTGAVALCLSALIVLTLLTVTDRKRDEWHGKAAA